jgi:hypothetical protein
MHVALLGDDNSSIWLNYATWFLSLELACIVARLGNFIFLIKGKGHFEINRLNSFMFCVVRLIDSCLFSF